MDKVEKILATFAKDDAIKSDSYIKRAGWRKRLANKLEKAGMAHSEAQTKANDFSNKILYGS